MKGHGQFCPVAVACEVFAHRWTPLILRELLAGSTHFNEIKRGLPLISKTTLAQRLRALEQAGVVRCVSAADTRRQEYRLTAAGEEFKSVIQGLGAWGQRWTIRVDPHNLDADLLMWNIRRRLAPDRHPRHASGSSDSTSSVCRPARVATDVFWLISNGLTWISACRIPAPMSIFTCRLICRRSPACGSGSGIPHCPSSGLITLTGHRQLMREFPSWLLLSHFAGVPRPNG